MSNTMAAEATATDAATQDAPKRDAMGRKVWDKAYYEQKYKEKMDMLQKDLDGTGEGEAGGKGKGGKGAAHREHLRARDEDLNLESTRNERKIISANTARKDEGGFWCSVCECLLKDSIAYLDHINGKKHNRKLGMNMRVKQTTTNDLDDMFSELKRKRDDFGTTLQVSQAKAAPISEELLAEQIRREEEEKKLSSREKKRLKKERKKERDDREKTWAVAAAAPLSVDDKLKAMGF